jgi:hypothetical protein
MRAKRVFTSRPDCTSGLACPQYRGSSAARRYAGDLDAPRADGVVVHDLAGDAGDDRRLALIALLIPSIVPIPAL